jgi:GTP cyclohydrolase I
VANDLMVSSREREAAARASVEGVHTTPRQTETETGRANCAAEPIEHGGRRVVAGNEAIDLGAAESAVHDLLVSLGRDPSRAHLADTPRRVVHAFAELLACEPFDLTTFANDEHYDELVLVREIPFRSLCEHHLLPFHGVACVGYLPAERIVGLSKLARVVHRFAADLQTQERLTMEVADWLEDHLQPTGIGVVIEADHTCMTLRGVRAQAARTVTSALRGQLRHDERSRAEFLALVAVGS